MNDVILRPVRFTDDVAGVRAFFEQQGLAARVVADGGGWVDLAAGGGGMLALHDAASSSTEQPSGRTTLSAECQDAEALAERLHEAGFDDATVYDEGYGRVLVVTDPDGGQVQVDERQDDLHGYQRLDVSGADRRCGCAPRSPARRSGGTAPSLTRSAWEPWSGCSKARRPTCARQHPTAASSGRPSSGCSCSGPAGEAC